MPEEADFIKEDFYEHYRFEVDPGQEPLRIDKFLINRIPNTSRTKIQNAADSDCILVNGRSVKNNYKVKPSDIIRIVLPEPPEVIELFPENIPINIIYEDNNIIIVNKEAGMVVHPAYANYSGTLVNALLYHFNQLAENSDQSHRPGLVHRIDKDTSGLLVIAKDEFSMTFLSKQFYDHTISRKYIALVWGNIENDFGTINYNLARDPKDRRRVVALKSLDEGKTAVTHYTVKERFGYVTLLECELETGRTHQIRAHLRAIGHPLFNDEMYGGKEILFGPSFSKYKQFIDNCFNLIPGQALHAKSLGFVHPLTRKSVFFDSELPEGFLSLLEKWRKYSVSG